MRNVLTGVLLVTTLTVATTPLAARETTKKQRRAAVLYDRGVDQNREGLLVAASVSLTDSIALDPSRSETYYQRGLSFAGLGSEEAAIQDFRAAIERGTDRLDAYLRVFAWCRDRRLYEDGIRMARLMIAAMPFNEAGATLEIGRFQEALGDPEAALVSIRRALTLSDPNDEEFRSILRAEIARLSNH